jgi:hypothetical protein
LKPSAGPASAMGKSSRAAIRIMQPVEVMIDLKLLSSLIDS